MNGQGCPMRGQGVAHGGQGCPMEGRGWPIGWQECPIGHLGWSPLHFTQVFKNLSYAVFDPG